MEGNVPDFCFGVYGLYDVLRGQANVIPMLGNFGGCNIRFCRQLAIEWTPEFMVPIQRCPSSQSLKCPTISSRYIPVVNLRVWWLCRMVTTFTWPEPFGLFSVEMHEVKSVCNLSINIPGTSKLHYGCVLPAMLYNAQREA